MARYVLEDDEPQEAQFVIEEEAPAPVAQPVPARQPATTRQKFQSSLPMRVVQGARDPIDAGAQLLPHSLAGLTSGFGFAPNAVSDYFASEAARVDAMNAKNEQEYQDARRAVAGPTVPGMDWRKSELGFDGGRLAGNIVSPANLAIARVLPITAPSTAGRVWQGARAGAVGGALQPVDMSDGGGFWSNKLAQSALGAATGGVFTPVLSKVSEKVAGFVARKTSPATQLDAGLEADRIIREALEETGQRLDDLPKVQYENLRLQVWDALKSGKKLDAAAMMRKQDFEAEKIPPLQSWVTRDPQQYATEMNLRGLNGIGDPLMQRYSGANTMLQKGVGKYAEGAVSDYQAGNVLRDSLQNVDEQMRRQVTAAYTAARNSAGKDMDIPLTGLAQDYARVLGDYADNVPPAIRAKFASLGLDPMNPSNQRKVFTMADADELLKVINKNDPGFSNKPVSSALGELRAYVKKAITETDASGGPFAPAVKLAAQRFRIQDAVPALRAAANGEVPPDDFVKKFVINGKVDEVRGMVRMLPPDAKAQAKAQIGAVLQRAAFGENTAGDKAFSQERFSKALRTIGDEKLTAFFTPQEVESIKRMGRIGSYINSAPAFSAVNRSNTASTMANLFGNAQNLSRTAAVINSVTAPIKNAGAVNRALRADLPKPLTNLTPEQMRYIGQLAAGGSAAVGLLGASPVK